MCGSFSAHLVWCAHLIFRPERRFIHSAIDVLKLSSSAPLPIATAKKVYLNTHTCFFFFRSIVRSKEKRRRAH